MRGKRCPFGFDEDCVGLIPACAGKTLSKPFTPLAARAHPRVCGENFCFMSLSPPSTAHPRVCGENPYVDTYCVQNYGSSPRVRGKPAEADYFELVGGLIPACAGKTLTSAALVAIVPAHPRVCGENVPFWSQKPRLGGSSPRVRGKLMLSMRYQLHRRLIPACAGKTSRRCRKDL